MADTTDNRLTEPFNHRGGIMSRLPITIGVCLLFMLALPAVAEDAAVEGETSLQLPASLESPGTEELMQCCVGITGDANDDGRISIVDAYIAFGYQYGGPPPVCVEEADFNGDGMVMFTDGIYALSYLFLGGLAPAECP
jgi:hypothetical protein